MSINEKYFRIAEKIAAWLTGVASEDDRRQLDEWQRENARHDALFQELSDVGNFRENQQQLSRFPAGEAWRKIETRLEPRRTIRRAAKYAALLLLLLGAGLCYRLMKRPVRVETTVLTQAIPSGKQGAKLHLGNGNVVEMTADDHFTYAEVDGTLIRKDTQGIDYTQMQAEEDTVVYNQMETLTGMEYALTLSDGTRVFLNAESRMTYPVAFRGEQRVVELVGEAWFKVAKDSRHPFIVRMNGVDVKVVGTIFNARSYANESDIVTTLVEGKVEVNGQRILPGQQATFMRNTGKLIVRTVDADQYTAWRQGRFLFRNERLEDMMKTLARWYGIEYHFLDEEVKDLRFGARFNRYEDMNPILDMLKKTNLVTVVQTNRSIYLSARK